MGYVTIDDAGLVTEANMTATQLLGADRPSLVGQPFAAFVDSHDRDVFYITARTMERTGEPQAFDLRLCRASHGAGEVPGGFWAHLESCLLYTSPSPRD